MQARSILFTAAFPTLFGCSSESEPKAEDGNLHVEVAPRPGDEFGGVYGSALEGDIELEVHHFDDEPAEICHRGIGLDSIASLDVGTTWSGSFEAPDGWTCVAAGGFGVVSPPDGDDGPPVDTGDAAYEYGVHCAADHEPFEIETGEDVSIELLLDCSGGWSNLAG